MHIDSASIIMRIIATTMVPDSVSAQKEAGTCTTPHKYAHKTNELASTGTQINKAWPYLAVLWEQLCKPSYNHWTKSQISYTSMYTGNVHGIWLYLSLALYFNYNADIP